MNILSPAIAPEADVPTMRETDTSIGGSDRLPILLEAWRSILRWKWVIVGIIGAFGLQAG